MQRNCPSQWAYIATEDGGYITASNVEEDDLDDSAQDEEEGQVFGGDDTSACRAIIVQQVFSVQVEHEEKLQCHNLFQIFFVIKNRRAHFICFG